MMNKTGIYQIIITIAVAAIAWSGHTWTLALCLLFPVIWFHSKNRTTAGLISLSYFLIGSKGVVVGAINYLQNGVWQALYLWGLAAVIFSLPFFLLWHPKKMVRCWTLPLILLIESIPPIGIISWGNPLHCAGILFPSTGILGCFLTIMLILILSTLKMKWLIVSIPLLCLPSLSNKNMHEHDWIGIDTHYSHDLGQSNILTDMDRQHELIDIAIQAHQKVIVFPEGSAGQWRPGTLQIWKDNQQYFKDKTILIGAKIPKGKKYTNAIIKVSKDSIKTVYTQRVPIPLMMWNPTQKDSVIPHFFSKALLDINQKKISPLICYETFIIWPIIQSLWLKSESDILLAIGSLWWARDTTIPRIQNVLLYSWARLFNLKLITSFNY